DHMIFFEPFALVSTSNVNGSRSIQCSSGNVVGHGLPLRVAAIRATRAHEQTFSRRTLVSFEPPVQPREVDLGEVPAVSGEQVATMAEVFAEPHQRYIELTDVLVISKPV